LGRKEASLIIERYVHRREVLIYFIAVEEHKSIQDYTDKSDKELEETVKRLSFTHGTNPFGIYLVGTNCDRRNELIDRWVLGLIPTKAVYSCGVDDKWNPFLTKNRGNLEAMVTSHQNLPPLLSIDGLSPLEKTIVTIKQTTAGKDGEFEVIDGFHRAVAQIRCGYDSLRSYVGVLREQ
jgi:hypothetical protein